VCEPLATLAMSTGRPSPHLPIDPRLRRRL
jgi:hypothetical protein